MAQGIPNGNLPSFTTGKSYFDNFRYLIESCRSGYLQGLLKTMFS